MLIHLIRGCTNNDCEIEWSHCTGYCEMASVEQVITREQSRVYRTSVDTPYAGCIIVRVG